MAVHEVHVGVACAAHARQDVTQRLHGAALETGCLGEPQPLLEPAFLVPFATALNLRRGVGRTLVVVDALDPLAPEGCLLGLRQNEAGRERDAGLG